MDLTRNRIGLSPYTILTGLCSSRMLLYLSIQSYPALIPVLQKEWEMSNAAAGSIISAYQTGFLISVVGLSVLTDWVSTKKVYLYSCLAFALSCFLFAVFARSYSSALLLRLLMGLSIGGTYTPALKLISETFFSTLRGRAMGLFIAAGSLGHAGSLAATGWLTARYGWQARSSSPPCSPSRERSFLSWSSGGWKRESLNPRCGSSKKKSWPTGRPC